MRVLKEMSPEVSLKLLIAATSRWPCPRAYSAPSQVVRWYLYLLSGLPGETVSVIS